MKRKYLLPAILLSVLCIQVTLWGQSNEGKEFWFGFMEHIDRNQNTMVAMITSKYNTSGEISMPGQGWRQSFSVAANQVSIIQLPASAENIGSEFVQNNGIRIISRDPVSVYIHQYHGFRSEAAVVLPVDALGQVYYTVSYKGYDRQGEIYPSEFLIVAVADDTQVEIFPDANTAKGTPRGGTQRITLQTGQVYQVQARSAQDDLTGSLVKGNKAFALFSGNRWTGVPEGCAARDNLLEQMYPVETWGKIFVTAPHANMNYGILRMLAAESTTHVVLTTAGGRVYNYDLSAGEYQDINLSEPSYIFADKALMVTQYIIGSSCSGYPIGDPSMVVLNSIEQTRDTVTLYNSTFEAISENYLNIIARAKDIEAVILDGQTLAARNISYKTVGPDNSYAVASVRVNPGAHTLISDGCGVIATAYGYGEVESYAYGGGASFRKINANPIPEGGCLNDTIAFDTKLSPRRFRFFWDLGDGTTSTDAVALHQYKSLGTYPVQLILTDECLNTIDTFHRKIFITLRQAVVTKDPNPICKGETLQLSATDLSGAQYKWLGPNGFESLLQFPVIAQAQPDQTGRYEVKGIISGCATFPAYSEVIIHPLPAPELGPDTLVCTKYDLDISISPGNFVSYQWQNGSIAPDFPIHEEGVFWVRVSDENGCSATDSIALREQCPTKVFVPNAFSPNGDGSNDTFGPFGNDIIQLHFMVFDRWGNLLFESSGPDNHWDGRCQGKLLENGAYIWMMELEGYREDGSVFQSTQSGEVYLMR